MDSLSLRLLALTISFSAGRNLLSKQVSKAAFGTQAFFGLQTCIFAAGCLVLLCFGEKKLPSGTTVLLALIYAVFLILAQWCYTIALGHIGVSVCSTIYSLGFMIPTVSGAIFWNESFTISDFLGMCAVTAAILVSGTKGKSGGDTAEKKYVPVLVTAMLASGGLGLVQKVQQSLPEREEKGIFVILAFAVAAGISLAGMVLAKVLKTLHVNGALGQRLAVCEEKSGSRNNETNESRASGTWISQGKKGKSQVVFAALAGSCFGICNLLNTTLAGRLDSAVFFPLQNISVILLSIFLSCLIHKEKLTKRSFTVIGLGVAAIVLVNLS